MARYIDVGSYIEELNEQQIEGTDTYKGLGLAKKIALDILPSDVAPVKCARWVEESSLYAAWQLHCIEACEKYRSGTRKNKGGRKECTTSANK